MSSEEEKQQRRDEVAVEHFGKKFDELDSDEKMSVGGHIGGTRGGNIRKEQMSEQGTTEEGKMKGYSEMGHMGGKKGGFSTGYAHDPEEQKKYTDRTGQD